MPEAVLHIGAGKCGSSSIQTHLSRHPYFEGGGRRYEYVCLKQGCSLLRGSEVRKSAERSPYGYNASIGVREFFSETDHSALKRAFARIADEGRTPVLSFEGWMNVGKRFHDWRVLENLDLDVDVIGFVRPQVPWINSCWWQWGAWGEKRYDQWLEGWKHRGLWTRPLEAWRQLPRVKSVNFFPSSGDVIVRLLDFLEVAAPERTVRANSSLNGTILRLLQKHPHLRRGPRASAVDFILARFLDKGGSPTPWVIDEKTTCDLLDYYKSDNVVLAESVGGALAEDISADVAWSSIDAFASFEAEDPYMRELLPSELEEMLVQLLSSVLVSENRTRSRV